MGWSCLSVGGFGSIAVRQVVADVSFVLPVIPRCDVLQPTMTIDRASVLHNVTLFFCPGSVLSSNSTLVMC
jgi:hypothetical protein